MFKKRGKHRMRLFTSSEKWYGIMAVKKEWFFEYFSDVLDIRLAY